MRFAFLGSPPFATSSFAAVLESGLEMVGLVTAPPRFAGRGRKEAPNALADLAEARGLPVLRPESARDQTFQEEFAAWNVDLGVVVSYGQLLDKNLLAIPAFGCINLHGSLLPRWRGASPVQAAILAGDSETGLSLQKMVLALDAGDVLRETSIPLDGNEKAPELFTHLANLSATFLVEALSEYELAGELPPGIAQDNSKVTLCKKIRKQDGILDWSDSYTAIDRRVRAMSGWPAGQTWLPDGVGLRVHKGTPLGELSTAENPGTILSLTDGMTIACGTGSYRIEKVQREGKAQMDAAAFVLGAQIHVGERLSQNSS